MLEVDEFIGGGNRSCYFRIKGRGSLGIKIRYPFLTRWRDKWYFNKELRRGVYLRSIDVSVPRYVEVALVSVPKNIREIIINSKARQYSPSKEAIAKMLKPGYYFGLIMESIADHSELIPIGLKQALFAIEKQKLDRYGIIAPDLNSSTNVLYGVKRGMEKIYLIDFELWIFPKSFGV